jgi:hypothetical protein
MFDPDRMQVANIRDLVRHHYLSCSPLQYLRELTVNSIQSIMRKPEQTGIIVWDLNWDYYNIDNNVRKLSITDTGDGIDPSMMEIYLNQLVSGIKTSENFGIGGKIATVPNNELGTIYESWSADNWDKESPGKTISIGLVDGDYGLQFIGDHKYAYLSQEDAPRSINQAKSGTRVTLFGNEEYEDTLSTPEGIKGGQKWISKYLNSKFFNIPQNIKIYAREWIDKLPRYQPGICDAPEGLTAGDSPNFVRRIQGMSQYLDTHKISHGELRITGSTDHGVEVPATAYWWILDEDKSHNYVLNGSHAACLYENNYVTEIYDVKSRHMLKQFGVFSKKDVVIYIKPDKVEGLSPTGARDRLKIGQYEMPWVDWASSFASQLPPEIGGLYDLDDNKADIKKILKELYDLIRIPSKSECKEGLPEEIDRVVQDPTGDSIIGRSRGYGGSKSGKSARGVISGRITKPVEDKPNMMGEDIPTVIWTSTNKAFVQEYHLEERSIDDEGDELDDRAAVFYEGSNVLQINFDFRVFQAHINYLLDTYTTTGILPAAAKHIIIKEAMQAHTVSLIESILGIKSLNLSKPQQMQALNSLSLTAAAMSFYHKRQTIVRNAGALLNHSIKKK